MDLKIELHDIQKVAFKALTDETTEEVLFGGGARGGKSFLGCCWLITQAFSKPGSTWLMGRTVLKELYNSTLVSFWESLKALEKINGLVQGTLSSMVKFNEKRGTLYFKENDVLIYLMDLSYQPSDPEYNRIGSLSLTGCFIDEAQQVHPKAISVLSARFSLLSNTDENGNVLWRTCRKCLYTCNPDKGWIYRDFYEPFKNGTLDVSKKFIASLVTDNTKIPEEDRVKYIKGLKDNEKSDPVSVQRLLYGNFDYDDTDGRIFQYDALNDMFTNGELKGRKYITCDVARKGKDSTVIMLWNGYVVEQVVSFNKETTDFTAEKIKQLAHMNRIAMSQVIVDEDGVGGGLVDQLKCRGFINNSTPISPISKKYLYEKKRNYKNLKTQCYMCMADLVNLNKITVKDVTIKEKLVQELDVVLWTNIDKDEPIKISSKDEIKAKIGRSPDYADCMCMRIFFDFFLRDEELPIIDTKDVAEERPLYMIEFDKYFEGVLQEMRGSGRTYEAKMLDTIS